MSVFSTSISSKTIVVDAGHGGFDPGASANGVVEKNLNLKIAQKLASFIEQGGGTVVLTRNEDDVKSSGKKVKDKNLDLRERKKIADRADADIFVSIHMNKCGDRSVRGSQTFYQKNSEMGEKLANSIQSSLAESLGKFHKKNAKEMDRTVFVLKKVKAPTVIVECGFISNSSDARALNSEEYQNKLAFAVYLGILKYFS